MENLFQPAEIASIVLPEEKIKSRVAALGRQITQDYAGKRLIMVGVLKGAVPFLADLIRCVPLPLQYDFIAVASYGASTVSSGAVRMLKDLELSVEGFDVLLVEDIIDTGLTLRYLRENLYNRHPASLRIAALLNKPSRRGAEITADYCGFTVPDEFLVGYGLDYNQNFRNLPYVGALKREVWQER
ncbi:MAG: hypoxanthine phosphoribosyltransferase [Gracilibacteraceae bacterium]|nr:hypoxanthine phosphoribosyltransferase [Gracilibacteraceae bacterium]